jgi:hypothetical protein
VIVPAPGTDDSGRVSSTPWLTAAVEITLSCLSEPSGPVLQSAVDRAAVLADADLVALALALAGADGLEVRAACPMSGPAEGPSWPVPADRVTLAVLATARPATGAGTLDVLTAVAPGTVVRHFAAVPFTSAGTLAGVLYAGRAADAAFAEPVVRLLAEFRITWRWRCRPPARRTIGCSGNAPAIRTSRPPICTTTSSSRCSTSRWT